MNSGIYPMILHMDMDAFFASVEELANPAIRGKPVVVAGPGERSIITTASYAARKYGIRTGMTVRQAKTLCRNAVIIKSDYRKYSDASRKVMSVLETFTPEVHATSVDEAFLDIKEIVKSYNTPLDLARDIKRKVRTETGLTCSVGIAGNWLLAKLASGMNKPDGLTVLEPEEVKAILERTPVEKLCGIGPVTTGRLNEMGIRTCGQLGRYPEDLLRRSFGSYGPKLSRMGRGEEGIYQRGGQSGRSSAKSIGHSVTLPNDLTDRLSMGKVLQTLAEMVGRRARRHNCRGKTVTLTWRYDDFSTRTHRSTLPSPICLTEEIYRVSMMLLDDIDIMRPVRLLGISLSDLSFEAYTTSLLPEDIRKEGVQKTLDGINDRFGEFTLAYGESIPDLRSQKVISPSWRSKGIKNSF
jgi:DNA polymerase-4